MLRRHWSVGTDPLGVDYGDVVTHRIQTLGDAALLVDGNVDSGIVLPGVTDIVPAFGATAVHFDPELVPTLADASPSRTVAEWVVDHVSGNAASASREADPVSLPTLYGGEHGPDLEAVANAAGLPVDETVRRHAAAEYAVGAIGFKPGFPYLTGLPAELQTPRQATPRKRVPAGSVGIGGPYTGVYPSESPGGWNLIGQTPLRLFDKNRPERSLLRIGDRVRFESIDLETFERLAREPPQAPVSDEELSARPLLRVVSPGVQLTVQDAGNTGLQHVGVSPGGAMDRESLRLANCLVGNRPDAPALEATLVGPILECIDDVTLGVAGATGRPGRTRYKRGERIDLRPMTHGARVYVAVPGGVTLQAGEALGAGLELGSLDEEAVRRVNASPQARWSLPPSVRAGTIELRCLPGPQVDRFDRASWRRFSTESYRVSPDSSRMGLRLQGEALHVATADDASSQPIVVGAVQVPPDGQPIVLAADRQTLGGYPVIACVVSVDWPRLGQLRPGDSVRFVEVDLPTAERLRSESERRFSRIATGIRIHTTA